MESKLGLGKSYRIIRTINCCVYGFGAFFSALDTMRMINGLACNPFSPIAFIALSISLLGIHVLEGKRKRFGIIMLVLGGIIGGWCISADPDHPNDALITLIVFGGLAIFQALSVDWKEFFNRKNMTISVINIRIIKTKRLDNLH